MAIGSKSVNYDIYNKISQLLLVILPIYKLACVWYILDVSRETGSGSRQEVKLFMDMP